MIAFSTSWNSGRHTAGDEMLREIQALGFNLIELGHGIRISLMPGIQKMFEAGEVRFSSLHNFCPLPVEVMSASPDCYEISSPDRRERERALKQTLQTIDFAERLQAPFVVLHCGSVRMNPITDELIALAKEGELLSRRYVRKKVNAVKTREQRSPAYLARVKDSLQPIVQRAAEKKIRLGIEGRRGYEEIPSEREIPPLLDEIAAPHVGYWHDMGHIQIKENLGFLDHAEWLRQIRPRTFGCHMQDVKWPAQDHQPPFLGDMKQLEPLTRMLPPDCQIVWELSPRRPAEEIAQAIAIWRERFSPATESLGFASLRAE
jgi:sugar phosphate isomerase/epimerase